MRLGLTLDGQDALSVRHFSVSEAMSAPFHASVVGTAPGDDLDLEGLVGAPASFQIGEGEGARTWTGVASDVEQLASSGDGASTYRVTVKPTLALLAHRAQSRVFTNLSVPEIVEKVFGEMGVRVQHEVDRAAHPKHEYRVQHGESDLDFAHRLLEEAGIAYRFDADEHGAVGDAVTLTDRAHRREPKATLRYVEQPGASATGAYVTRVAVSRAMGPGAVSVRDHDFQRQKGVKLRGAAAATGAEAKLAHSVFHVGAIVRHGVDKADDLAKRALEGARARLKTIAFEATTTDLAPGTVFALADHPRADLASSQHLLALELGIDGTSSGHLAVRGVAAPASVPHRPEAKTARPHVAGLESGTVVGPKGEPIHTDEHGRVKVQLAWDQDGPGDDTSSCWVRVSQAWAGAGFGMVSVPRVGQEVLVGFLGGDPDQPVVVGRVYNAENAHPYKLPENKTKTGLRTASVPDAGDGAFNEIAFEDKQGSELVSLHAERDLEIVVKGSETERTGADRTLSVGKNHAVTVGAVDSTLVGKRHTVAVSGASGAATRIDMSDRQIVCTTGQATVTFDGPDLTLEAQGNVTIVAHDGDVVIQGGPNVKINC
ncbi:MAG TPA: type VI secretion system tip protein TssI/VgrG [Byssovorax sp.]|jgi:type VI secretion system secreted protein VgrG|nr:type VI secretion system tip protein TssI/VgrG [Polyangia bacterium]